MADIEYRGTYLKVLNDGGDGTQINPVTVVRGLSIKQPDGTYAEVSDDNPVPIALAPVPAVGGATITLAPGDSATLIPAPPIAGQCIILYGIWLLFQPSYVTGTESVEVRLCSQKGTEAKKTIMPLPGVQTFSPTLSSPIQNDVDARIFIEVPNSVSVPNISISYGIQFRYGYPLETDGGGGTGTVSWGDISGNLVDQLDLEARFASIEGTVSFLDNESYDNTVAIEALQIDVLAISTTNTTQSDQISALQSSSTNQANQIAALTSPLKKGGSLFLPTTPTYEAAATAPTGKVIRISFLVGNYGATSANMRYTYRNNLEVALGTDIYIRSIGVATISNFFSNVFVKNGESIGIYSSLATMLSAAISSEVVEGDCFSALLSTTPVVPSETFSSTSFRTIYAAFYNNTGGTPNYSISVLNASDTVVARLAVARVISWRSAETMTIGLAPNQKLELRSATNNEIFCNLYIEESPGW